jgi:hypothetical protein
MIRNFFLNPTNSNKFIPVHWQITHVRTWIIAAGLCIFLFILPFQCFIIGDNNGFGIQGAVFRLQVTSEGTFLIPIPRELVYVTSGIYSGKTALSVILWILGTVVLTLTTVSSLIYWNRLPQRYLRSIVMGITGAVVLYLASCIAQYGPLFHGPAGVSLPLGVLVLFIFAIFVYGNQNFFYSEGDIFQKSENA